MEYASYSSPNMLQWYNAHRKGAILMTLQLEIPDSVAQAMRLPGRERKKRLMVELALLLYAQGILSFGKARQLAEKKPLLIWPIIGTAPYHPPLRRCRYAGRPELCPW